MNGFKTTLLLATLTGLFLWIGQKLAGGHGLTLALLMAAVMNLSAYWFSDKIVLAMYRARLLEPGEAHQLQQIVAELAERAAMPCPKVYIIDDRTPNAFATGRNPQHASVAATTGLLAMLNRQELTGVMAHELSHVLHRDTLISAIAAMLGGAISSIAHMAMWFGASRDENGESHPVAGLLAMLVAPIAAMLIQMAISRSREFSADERGARLCGHPEWLASALQKLEMAKQQMVSPLMEQHPATAHLFIVNPLHGSGLANLFSTHPSTEERVKRLLQM